MVAVQDHGAAKHKAGAPLPKPGAGPVVGSHPLSTARVVEGQPSCLPGAHQHTPNDSISLSSTHFSYILSDPLTHAYTIMCACVLLPPPPAPTQQNLDYLPYKHKHTLSPSLQNGAVCMKMIHACSRYSTHLGPAHGSRQQPPKSEYVCLVCWLPATSHLRSHCECPRGPAPAGIRSCCSSPRRSCH